MKKKKQQRIIGSIIKVNIDNEYHTYARIIVDKNFAFYDLRTKEDITNLDLIISSKVLFCAMVNNRGIEDGYWKIIGERPLTEENLLNVKFYDTTVDGNQFRIWEPGTGYPRNASKEECIGLDTAGICDPVHIESILQDHYAGRENVYIKMDDVLENYKLKKLCWPY